jgi:hypothetical protein
MSILLNVPGLRDLALRFTNPSGFFKDLAGGKIPAGAVGSIAERAGREPDRRFRIGNFSYTGRELIDKILAADGAGLSPEKVGGLMVEAYRIGGFDLLASAGPNAIREGVVRHNELATEFMAKGGGRELTRLADLFESLPPEIQGALVLAVLNRRGQRNAGVQAVAWTTSPGFLNALAEQSGQNEAIDRAVSSSSVESDSRQVAVLAGTTDAQAVHQAGYRLARSAAGGDPGWAPLLQLEPAHLDAYLKAAERAIEAAKVRDAQDEDILRRAPNREDLRNSLRDRGSACQQLSFAASNVISKIDFSLEEYRQVERTLLESVRNLHGGAAEYGSYARTVEEEMARNPTLSDESIGILIDVTFSPPSNRLSSLARNPALGPAHLGRIADEARRRMALAVAEPDSMGVGIAEAVSEIIARPDTPPELREGLAADDLVRSRVDVEMALFLNPAVDDVRKLSYLREVLADPDRRSHASRAISAALAGATSMSFVRQIASDPAALEHIDSRGLAILADRWATARGLEPPMIALRPIRPARDDSRAEFVDVLVSLQAHLDDRDRLPEDVSAKLMEADAPGARDRDPDVVGKLLRRAQALVLDAQQEGANVRIEADLVLKRLLSYAKQGSDEDLAREALGALSGTAAHALRGLIESPAPSAPSPRQSAPAAAPHRRL